MSFLWFCQPSVIRYLPVESGLGFYSPQYLPRLFRQPFERSIYITIVSRIPNQDTTLLPNLDPIFEAKNIVLGAFLIKGSSCVAPAVKSSLSAPKEYHIGIRSCYYFRTRYNYNELAPKLSRTTSWKKSCAGRWVRSSLWPSTSALKSGNTTGFWKK